MNLVLSHAAEIALRTLGDEDRRKVHAWFDYLKNWDNDQFVRSKSRKLELPGSDEVYVLKTTTDLHLFFILHPNHIEIIDIARSDSLQTVSQAS
jgi:hypothetical protein